MHDKKRAGTTPPADSPFAVLAQLRAPAVATPIPDARLAAPATTKSRGRVSVLRSAAHRGGKTVTVIKGFFGLGASELEQLAKRLQKACGAGGTVKGGCIEIQGDQRKLVMALLEEAGFRPVAAGG